MVSVGPYSLGRVVSDLDVVSEAPRYWSEIPFRVSRDVDDDLAMASEPDLDDALDSLETAGEQAGAFSIFSSL